jgi:hypothetical protein
VIEILSGPSSRRTAPAHLHLGTSSSLLTAFRATDSEWQAYGYYNHRIASILGGTFDAGLWQRLVVQVADTEPTIRHGIFALGHLFRHDDVTSNVSECTCDHCRQALRQFNKSIGSFAQHLRQPSDQQSTEVALLSCLIYICMEAYRLNDDNAISLIAKGCRIIAETLPNGPDMHRPTVDPRLVQLFDRLWLLSSMFGKHIPRPSARPLQVFDSFEVPVFDTIETARDCLHELITFTQSLRLRVARVQLSSMSACERSATIITLQKEQRAILALFRNWQTEFQRLTGQLQMQTPPKSQAASIVTVQYLIAKITASASMDPLERETEDQTEDFSNLVNAAEASLTKFHSAADAKYFSLETGCLPALYLTVRKCRDPLIRRKALELMCLSGTKESLWWRPELTTIAARVIELEEGLAVLDAEEAQNAKPLRFYDVLVDMNYRRAGKTFVDVKYLIYDAKSELRWRSMRETLVVAE